mmetsp:Transcript_83501/g.147891  ORF Transcript_83501/g.147891 Transcript_83501/m.147891 type:complete len:239 (-) Transcript_83501:205-921(-)
MIMPIRTVPAIAPIWPPKRSKPFCSGVCVFFCFTPSAILPTSVVIPVFTTMPLPCPLVINVAAKHIFFENAASRSSGARHLCTGSDSPVNGASSAKSSFTSNMRISAGVWSPVLTMTTSPGTSSAASMVSALPSRTTVHVGAVIFASASRAFPALTDMYVPRQALPMTMTKIAMPSYQTLRARQRIAAARSIITTKDLNSSKKTFQMGSFSSAVSAFLPYWACRLAIFPASKPFSRFV